MSEGDRDEVTVLVAPKQDQRTVSLGGGGFAVPSVLTWATLLLQALGALLDPQTPAFPDQILTWTRTSTLSTELSLWSISATNSKRARPFPGVAQFPQMHKGCMSKGVCNCEALDGDLLKV